MSAGRFELNSYDRRFDKQYDRGFGREDERSYDRNLDRNLGINLDRSYDRNLDRNYDRNYDKNYYRNLDRNLERHSSTRHSERSSEKPNRFLKDDNLNEKDSKSDKDVLIPSTRNERIVQTIVDFIIIIVVVIIFAIVYVTVDPKIKYFYCHETDIFYPYVAEIIPFWAVGIYGVLGPVLIILFVELFNIIYVKREKSDKRSTFKTFLIHFFHAISLFIVGAVITILLTEIGKRWVGRLRPHFISVCKPNFTAIDCTSDANTGTYYNPIYTGDSFCTGDEAKVKEARLSFPSGHSSFAWYTMIYAIIFLEARFTLLCFRYVKTILQMTCFITAFVTMLSRVSDHHHRGSDVIAGSILGLVVGLFITLFTGKVLFKYNRPKEYIEIDIRRNSIAPLNRVDYK